MVHHIRAPCFDVCVPPADPTSVSVLQQPAICVLYGQNFSSVERNYFMPRLVSIIFREVFLLDPTQYRVYTLQILTTNISASTTIAINLARLEVENQ